MAGGQKWFRTVRGMTASTSTATSCASSLALFELDTLEESACDAYNLEHAQAAITLYAGARPADLPTASAAHGIDVRQDPASQARELARRLGAGRKELVLAVCGQLPDAERGSALAQEEQAEWAGAFLRELRRHQEIERVLCAGRPGWEVGMAAAAIAQGVAVEATMPKGFAQRGISRVSTPRLPWQLQAEIEHWARRLRLLEGG